jgi:hypothetical protein
MDCYECAKRADNVAAVAVCRGCGAGLCMDHLHEEANRTVGGMNVSCEHDTWRPSEAGATASSA